MDFCQEHAERVHQVELFSMKNAISPSNAMFQLELFSPLLETRAGVLEALCFLAFGLGERRGDVPVSVKFLPPLFHGGLSCCIPRPPTSSLLGGDNCQYAGQKAQVPATQRIVNSLWYLQITQPLGKCPSPCTEFASHAPKVITQSNY